MSKKHRKNRPARRPDQATNQRQLPVTYDEIARLKREKARAEAERDFERAATMGGIPAVRELFFDARDASLLQEEFRTAIQDAISRAESIEQLSHQRLAEAKQYYESESKTHPVPLTIEQIDHLATTLEGKAVEVHNRVTEAIQQRGFTSAKEALIHALDLATIVGVREIQINLLRALPELFTNPFAVCFELIKECLMLGEPSVKTASRLDITWIKENISERIGTHEKLCEALGHAHRYLQTRSVHNSTLANLGQYASEHILSTDVLRKYLDYHSKTKRLANMASDELKAKYPHVLGG